MTTGLGEPSAVAAPGTPRPLAALVLEDDADLRELIAIHLRRAGCTVTATGRADEAFTVVRALGLDLAVVDTHLPRPADGDEVAALIRVLRPTCRVVRSSRRDDGVLPGAADVLTTPFTAADVRRLVPRRAMPFLPAPRSGADR